MSQRDSSQPRMGLKFSATSAPPDLRSSSVLRPGTVLSMAARWPSKGQAARKAAPRGGGEEDGEAERHQRAGAPHSESWVLLRSLRKSILETMSMPALLPKSLLPIWTPPPARR